MREMMPSERELMEGMEQAVAVVLKAFKLPWMPAEDLAQQVRLWSLEALASGKYDPSRPLAGYLVANAKNRCKNLLRDKLGRNDGGLVCASCDRGEPCSEGSHCGRYAAWLARQRTKKALFVPADFTSLAKDNARLLEDLGARDERGEREARELDELIDERLPAELRPYYLRMRDGARVTRAKRREVREAIAAILAESEAA